jgi:hypothetical protein
MPLFKGVQPYGQEIHSIPLDRNEFSHDWRVISQHGSQQVRNPWEFPEQAYRRGFQQGA